MYTVYILLVIKLSSARSLYISNVAIAFSYITPINSSAYHGYFGESGNSASASKRGSHYRAARRLNSRRHVAWRPREEVASGMAIINNIALALTLALPEENGARAAWQPI